MVFALTLGLRTGLPDSSSVEKGKLPTNSSTNMSAPAICTHTETTSIKGQNFSSCMQAEQPLLACTTSCTEMVLA